jgi:hypothetical protein
MHAIKPPTCVIVEPKKSNPTMIGIIDIPMPYTIPANVLPNSTVRSETGEVTNLSKVWFARSLGMVTGPIDEEAKKSVCAMRIGTCAARGMFRPMLKERKRLKGNSIPNMMDGGRV